jgi:hypothetical protein
MTGEQIKDLAEKLKNLNVKVVEFNGVKIEFYPSYGEEAIPLEDRVEDFNNRVQGNRDSDEDKFWSI